MKSSLSFPGMGAAVILIFAVGHTALAQGPLDPRIAKYDKGPATIDVSGYPADMQKRYKLFVTRCGKCHTIARPINCDFVLEDEWERYVKRMMRKPGSGINQDAGKDIYEFLVYDSKTRKKEMYDARPKEVK